ncbi:hypothetical protein [Oleidesulfovibrio alaskensis]|uniref:hypothetical protein n=1 Tax=Oleidesulfovibrio alaskensis TaxID=58180 RepID=UPI00041CE8C7|nr:hypothetical protein [Oleidesulfovibrio alaskensis]
MNIVLSIPESANSYWRQLGQSGLVVDARINCTVRDVLEKSIGFSDDYIEKRIETVFLDGHPVDDIDSALVPDGARMALASALPGAAGIAMRRNSPYAALRGGITHTHSRNAPAASGSIELALFNLVMHEHAIRILTAGAKVKTDMLAAMLERRPENSVRSVLANGEPLTPQQAVHKLNALAADRVYLQLEVTGGC